MKIVQLLKYKMANRTSAKRVEYLRAQGCKIGKGTRLLCGTGCFGTEPYLVEIGEDCLLSSTLSFFTHERGVKVLNSLNYFDGVAMDKVGKIVVGNNCFIGHGAKIMPGVTIGDNVIVGACAIVTKDVPSNSVVAGMPARVICTIDDFYNKNKDKFQPTAKMSDEEKKEYLLKVLG